MTQKHHCTSILSNSSYQSEQEIPVKHFQNRLSHDEYQFQYFNQSQFQDQDYSSHSYYQSYQSANQSNYQYQ